jgi:hypothetical protein
LYSISTKSLNARKPFIKLRRYRRNANSRRASKPLLDLTLIPNREIRTSEEHVYYLLVLVNKSEFAYSLMLKCKIRYLRPGLMYLELTN